MSQESIERMAKDAAENCINTEYKLEGAEQAALIEEGFIKGYMVGIAKYEDLIKLLQSMDSFLVMLMVPPDQQKALDNMRATISKRLNNELPHPPKQ